MVPGVTSLSPAMGWNCAECAQAQAQLEWEAYWHDTRMLQGALRWFASEVCCSG